MRYKLWGGISILVLASMGLWGQVPVSQILPAPVPLPGGDVIPGFGLINSFSPGPAMSGFDGVDADPHGITNFKGSVAMGYTIGSAMDGVGNPYVVITDIRVYQGDYVGVVAKEKADGSASARGHGTFVEI